MIKKILKSIFFYFIRFIGKRHNSFHKMINFACKEYWKAAGVNGMEKSIVHGMFNIINPKNLYLEEGVTLNHSLLIVARAKITIGKFTRISPGVRIITGELNYRVNHNSTPMQHISKEIKIGNNVWLATNSIILAGVQIGDNAVVAAGAVVTKDVPSRTIAYGIPAKTKPIL